MIWVHVIRIQPQRDAFPPNLQPTRKITAPLLNLSGSAAQGQPPVELLETPLQWPAADSHGSLGDGRFATHHHSPANVTELCELIAACSAESQPVYPQGGCTSLNYGGLPSRPGAIVSTKLLSKVIDYPAADMTITVESGMTLEALQAILSTNNQYLPIDPPQAAQATLGGIMATGWTGPRRHTAMRPRDQLIGIGFVNGSGTLIKGGGRVVKNVAGYDFPKLLTGSMGALGIIAELTYKVRPKPESTAIAWVSVPDITALTAFLDTLNHSSTRPTAIEVLNMHPASQIGSKNGLKSSKYVVAVGFDDSLKTVEWQTREIAQELPDGCELEIVRDSQALPLWHDLTESYANSGGQFTARVVTRPSQLSHILDSSDNDTWAIQAHAGQGIATFTSLHDLDLKTALNHVAQLTELVRKSGGSVSITHTPAAWKPEFQIWGEPRPDWSIMDGIKSALDPNRILNPGRFLDLC